MYNARFAYVHGLLLAVGSAALIAGLGWFLLGNHVRVENVVRDPSPLSSSATVAQVRERLDGQPQTMAGDQAGQAVAQSCPQVDIYPMADGAVLVCHG